MSESQSLQQNQESVLTYWWFDNFNQNVDSQTGKGAIDSTRIVEFSERNDVNLASSAAANVPKSKRRSLAPSGIDLPTVKVEKKGAQCYFNAVVKNWKQQIDKETKHFNELWMLGRVLSSKDQFLYPHFRDGVLPSKLVSWLT